VAGPTKTATLERTAIALVARFRLLVPCSKTFKPAAAITLVGLIADRVTGSAPLPAQVCKRRHSQAKMYLAL
jgi:hypothetical protein